VPWRTPGSAYESFFEVDGRFERSYLSGPYPPIEQSRPFGRFPRDKEGSDTEELETDPRFVRQAKEDTQTGHRYKRIFESKTIL
jgi:hypothetical protein